MWSLWRIRSVTFLEITIHDLVIDENPSAVPFRNSREMKTRWFISEIRQ
jgi:hypothetical protein